MIARYSPVTAGRLVKHERYSWLMLAESHQTKHLFAGMVRGGWGLYRFLPGRFGKQSKSICTTEEVEGEVSEKSLRNGANGGFWVPVTDLPGTRGYILFGRKSKMEIPDWFADERQNGNSGSNRILRDSLEIAYIRLAKRVRCPYTLASSATRHSTPLFHSSDCGYQTHPITALH